MTSSKLFLLYTFLQLLCTLVDSDLSLSVPLSSKVSGQLMIMMTCCLS